METPIIITENDKLIAVFDETKNDSVFEKKFKELFQTTLKDYIATIPNQYLNIVRPNTFAKDVELQRKIWSSLIDFLPSILTAETIELLEKLADMRGYDKMYQMIINDKKVFTFTINDQDAEIRPDIIPAKKSISFTYTEFFMLIFAKKLFHIEKMHIAR